MADSGALAVPPSAHLHDLSIPSRLSAGKPRNLTIRSTSGGRWLTTTLYPPTPMLAAARKSASALLSAWLVHEL